MPMETQPNVIQANPANNGLDPANPGNFTIVWCDFVLSAVFGSTRFLLFCLYLIITFSMYFVVKYVNMITAWQMALGDTGHLVA